MLRIDFVRLERDAEALLEEKHELESSYGVKHAAGDQRRVVGELVGILARKELFQYELLDCLLDVFSHPLCPYLSIRFVPNSKSPFASSSR